MNKKTLVMLLALVMIFGVFATSCGQKPAETETPETETESEETTTVDSSLPGFERGNVLTVGGTSPDGVFNPILYSTVYDGYICELVYDSLLSNDESGSLITDYSLTESFEQNEDLTEFVFHLRDGIKWHDGEAFTAEDVAFTFNTIAKPDYTGRSYTDGFANIVGAQDVKDGKAETISGIEVVDPLTVKVNMIEPRANNLYTTAISIIPKHVFDGMTFDQMSEKSREPIGTGAFKLVKYQPEQFVELAKNEEYWNTVPSIDGVIYKVVPEQDILSELQVGTIDAASFSSSIDNYNKVDSADFQHLELINKMNNGYSYAAFNFKNLALQDKNVRQALTYALDRHGFVNTFFGEKGGFVCHTPISPVSWAYPNMDDMNQYEFNKEKAIELLEEAGWVLPEGKTVREKDGVPLKFTWVSYNDAEWSKIITAMAVDSWKEIGVELTVDLMDFNSMATMIQDANNSDKWDIFNMAWGLTPDPDMSDIFSSTQFPPGNNRGFYSNPTLDEKMMAATKELDQEKRKELYQEIGKEFNEELPYIFIYIRTDPWLVNKRVQNFNPTEFIYWSDRAENIVIPQE